MLQVSREEALKRIQEQGETYKAEILDSITARWVTLQAVKAGPGMCQRLGQLGTCKPVALPDLSRGLQLLGSAQGEHQSLPFGGA